MSLWPFVWAAWPGAEYAVTTSMGGPESPGEHAMTEELLTSRCDVWHVTRDVVITPHCAGSGVTRACVSPTPWGRWCTAAGGGRGRGPGLGAGASSTSSGAASPRSWGSSACGSTCSMVLSSFPWPSSSCSAFYSSTGPSQIHHHFFHIKATLVSRTLNRTCYLFSVPLQTTPVLSWWIHTMEKFIKQVKSHIKANAKLIAHFTGRYYGDRAIYTCDSGHQLVGNEERVCQETGLWSGSEPYCKKRGELRSWPVTKSQGGRHKQDIIDSSWHRFVKQTSIRTRAVDSLWGIVSFLFFLVKFDPKLQQYRVLTGGNVKSYLLIRW